MLPSKTSRIDDYIYTSIRELLGFEFPRYEWLWSSWTDLPAKEVEQQTHVFVTRHFHELMAWETRCCNIDRLENFEELRRKATSVINKASQLTSCMIKDKYSISQHIPQPNCTGHSLMLSKINHGFWEQFILVFSDGYMPEVIRPTAKRGYKRCYIDSLFADALRELTSRRIDKGYLSHDGIFAGFGISFTAGDLWHSEFINRFSRLDEKSLIVARGAYAGLELFFGNVTSASSYSFIDGAYAKKSVMSGEIDRLIESLCRTTDCAFIVAPGHLANAKIGCLSEEKQKLIHVSSRQVHEGWPITLAGVSRPILSALSEGKDVVVLVQAAVFSALLPLFLLEAKENLNLSGNLSYIDLGQAMDAVNPECGKAWVKRITDGQDGSPIRIQSIKIA